MKDKKIRLVKPVKKYGPNLDKKLQDAVDKMKGKGEIEISRRKTWFSDAMDELDKEKK